MIIINNSKGFHSAPLESARGGLMDMIIYTYTSPNGLEVVGNRSLLEKKYFDKSAIWN